MGSCLTRDDTVDSQPTEHRDYQRRPSTEPLFFAASEWFRNRTRSLSRSFIIRRFSFNSYSSASSDSQGACSAEPKLPQQSPLPTVHANRLSVDQPEQVEDSYVNHAALSMACPDSAVTGSVSQEESKVEVSAPHVKSLTNEGSKPLNADDSLNEICGSTERQDGGDFAQEVGSSETKTLREGRNAVVDTHQEGIHSDKTVASVRNEVTQCTACTASKRNTRRGEPDAASTSSRGEKRTDRRRLRTYPADEEKQPWRSYEQSLKLFVSEPDNPNTSDPTFRSQWKRHSSESLMRYCSEVSKALSVATRNTPTDGIDRFRQPDPLLKTAASVEVLPKPSSVVEDKGVVRSWSTSDLVREKDKLSRLHVGKQSPAVGKTDDIGVGPPKTNDNDVDAEERRSVAAPAVWRVTRV